MPRFTLATVTPYLMVLLVATAGGPWGWVAAAYVTALVFVLDRGVAPDVANAAPAAEFPAADALLGTLAMLHFLMLGATIHAVAGAGAGALARADLAGMLLAAALLSGQVSHPAAHELIHRPSRRLRLLGRLIYTSLLFGHHASAHLRVHHVHVGSNGDPNSARRGEGFWRFLQRAWPDGFMAGLRAETKRHGGWTMAHPYALYLGGGLGACMLALALAGPAGLGALVFIALYAQIQIMLSDYVQHYGLRRARRPDGRLEPVGPRHSWNAPRSASSAMMLNAPRHSDHHVTPARPYPGLQMQPEAMPVLPHSLPVMAVIALFPPLWRRIMDPLCARWQAESGKAGAALSIRAPR